MNHHLKAWQDKVIYFILIDRFYNGDKSIDDFGKGEYDPDNDDCFQGGDLQGIIAKLPHIKSLGFDAIWITPPVHSQWINPYINVRGYHGYWPYDFKRVDPHFGTLEDYQRLVLEAHKLGLRVIQDIVVNHTGNYFTVDEKGYDPRYPEKTWRPLDGAYPPENPPKAPNDPVFCMNNPNIPEHRAAGVYNFTPNISDFKSREQTLTWSMGDLDDINLHSPLALKRLKEVYRFWIDAAGVDGFRVDTVYYTPEDFYERFLHDAQAHDLGVKRFAAQRGKRDFLVFGEVWSYDYKAINRYIKEGKTQRLDSAVDLPLNEALTQVFYRKLPTQRLRPALQAHRHHRHLWVNFLDNHDVERMCSRASWPVVQQSLVALFTLPGIPCVTYGTEAGFIRARQKMFSDECFNERSKQAAFLKRLIRLRKENPVLSRGVCKVERTSLNCGLLAYTLTNHEDACLVVFNTASDEMFYDLPAAASGWKVLFSSDGREEVPDSLVLAPESYLVLHRSLSEEKPQAPAVEPRIKIEPLASRSLRGKARLGFSLERPGEVAKLSLLDNDNYGRRLAIPDFSSGAFDLETSQLGNGRHAIRLLARTKAGDHRLSEPVAVSVRNPYRLLAKAAVREEHKGGWERKVHAPADPSYSQQLSMEEAAVSTSGKDLRLRLRMAGVTNSWNPPHGYDHVYFSVFFDFPDQRGKKFFPKLNYAREDFEFNAGFLLYGWGVRSFAAEDSTAELYGTPLFGDVVDAVDLKKRTITFTFSNRFFDSLKSFAGVKVFVSTWDGYLGELRSLSGRKEDWNFYVTDDVPMAQLPKIFDRITIPL